MRIMRQLLLLLLLLLLGCLKPLGAHAAVEVSELLPQLRAMRDASPDKVIRMNGEQLKRFGAGRNRPYTLMVFLAAEMVMDHPQLHMRKERREWGLAATAVARGPAPDSAFFLEIFFDDSQDLFKAMGVQMVGWRSLRTLLRWGMPCRHCGSNAGRCTATWLCRCLTFCASPATCASRLPVPTASNLTTLTL